MNSKRLLSACCGFAGLLMLTSAAECKPPAGEPLAVLAVKNDLRSVRVGMNVGDLSESQYTDIECADEPTKKLAAWPEYSLCRRDADGKHRVHFSFNESTNVLGPLDGKYRGTKVGGHPVLLTLSIDTSGRVAGLSMRTDPNARPFLRKKAFLLGRQAIDYYGRDGWSCHRAPPAADEMPLGETFVKEHCEKQAEHRHLAVDTHLYRKANDKIENFISESEVSVRWVE